MPYMKLTTPEIGEQERARVARELTEAVVRSMTPRNGRGLTADEVRERCTGGRLLTELVPRLGRVMKRLLG